MGLATLSITAFGGAAAYKALKQRQYIPLLFLFGYGVVTVLYFTVSNDLLVGMMTDRLKLYIIVMLALLCISVPLPRRLVQVCAWASCISVVCVGIWRIEQVRLGNRMQLQVEGASALLPPYATIQTVNESTYGLALHFDNLLAVANPLVMACNYEANCGWFPLRWQPGYPQALGSLHSLSRELILPEGHTERFALLMLPYPERWQSDASSYVRAKGKCIYLSTDALTVELWRLP
jgi:hypothetical protein